MRRSSTTTRSVRSKSRRAKADQHALRDYWFPGSWPAEPCPELGGNPRDVDKLHAELGGLTYRWSSVARTTGDSHLVFFSDFLWLVLTAWSQLPFGDSDQKLRKLRDATRSYLGTHAPEPWRTDHAATGIVFTWDEIVATRERARLRPTPAPLPAPPWFPVYDPTSLANGLMTIAVAVLHDSVGPERQGLPIPAIVYSTLSRLLLRYIGWCVPRREFGADAVAEFAARMHAERVHTPAKAAKEAMFFSADWLTRGMEAGERRRVLAEAREDARKLFGERLRKRGERVLDAKRSTVVAESMEVIDDLRKRLEKGGGFFVVQGLVRTALVAIATDARPEDIGARFASHLAPGLALGAHARRAKLDRARAALARTIANAVGPGVPSDPVALAERVCAGLGIPLRELCGVQFNSWVEVALGRQGRRTT